MAENLIFSRFSLISEINADDVFCYSIAKDTQKEDKPVFMAQLQAPWRENSDVVQELNDYFGCLQGVKGQGVVKVLAVTQDEQDGFGVAFEKPQGDSLENITDLDAKMPAKIFVDKLCEAIHKANVKKVFHCHLRKQDIWVSEDVVEVTGFGYPVVAKFGWKGNSIDLAPELALGEKIDSRSDVYSIARLLAEQYPDRINDPIIFRALDSDPGKRHMKSRELHVDLDKAWESSQGVKPKVNSGVKPKPDTVSPTETEDSQSGSDQQTNNGETSQYNREDTNMPLQGEERLRELVRNMVFDNYCDHRTERELIRDASEKFGIDQIDARLIISLELETLGAVNERVLLEELEYNLQLKARSRGKKLAQKDKGDVIEIVTKKRTGYDKGLDHQVAEQRFVEYCREHKVKVKSGFIGWKIP